MNIEEAKKKVEKYSFYPQDPKNNVIDIKTVLDIIDKIELDLQKPEIPQFVADWIEYCKKRTLTLKGLFSNSDTPAKIFDWIFGSDENCRLMAEAWINGYTVEKEKLYTVEIPNPNSCGGKLVLYKQQGTGNLILDMLNSNINKPKYLWLTEKEIRKDFEWAWQFAKEVTE